MLDEDIHPIIDDFGFEENNEILYAVAKIANKVVEDVASRYIDPILKSLNGIRGALNIAVFNGGRDDFASILAVDSTWTKPFVELVVGDIAVISTGYVIVAPAGIGSHGISYIALRRSSINESSFNDDVELDAKIMEFLTARKKMAKAVDVVMLDGSLYFSTTPEFFDPLDSVDVIKAKSRLSGPKLASLASTTLIKMLREADASSIPVVGVVKRVSSRFLLPILSNAGLKDVEDVLIKTNDKLLMSFTLRSGEYVVFNSYLEMLKQYLSYEIRKYIKIKRARKVLEILEKCYSTENTLLQELCSYMDNTAILFYKHLGDSVYPQAIRLDVYPRKAVEKVVSYVMYNTSHNCVPIPIDYVDRYIRLESSFVKKIYRILKAYTKNIETSIALSPTNPQKYYLFESM
ncbi:MAG: DNA double-strand break repair nuclease NurA [Ignisphaera sp.]